MSRPRRAQRPRLGLDLRPTRVIRVATIGLLIYALCLIPFYFLTPVHQSVQRVLGHPTSSGANASPPSEKAVPLGQQIVTVARSVLFKPEPANQPSVPLPATGSNDGQFAFLLLGYGGAGHDGAYLT